MRNLRLVAVAALVIALVVAAGRARSSSVGPPSAAPCSPTALAEAFTGPLALRSMDAYGCQGDFAYAWATIGPTAHEIGVTEVLRFEERTTRWVFVSRLVYCKPGVLPEVVYRLGCFSN